MKIDLYDFLDQMVGDIEIAVHERSDTGRERLICIGYPEEIQEHLKLTYSTTRYQVFYIQDIRHGILKLLVIERENEQ